MKRRDIITTIGGLILVALVVIATFWYGNQQRQDQLDKESQLKQEQQQKAEDQANSGKQQTPPQVTPKNNQSQTTQNDTAQPRTGAQPAEQTPQTGGEVAYILPVIAIAWLYRKNRQAKKLLKQAFLSV